MMKTRQESEMADILRQQSQRDTFNPARTHFPPARDVFLPAGSRRYLATDRNIPLPADNKRYLTT